MTSLVKVDGRVLIGSLHIIHAVHKLFHCHPLEWVARTVGCYNREIMREFYTPYVVTLRGSFDMWWNPTKDDPLIDV